MYKSKCTHVRCSRAAFCNNFDILLSYIVPLLLVVSFVYCVNVIFVLK